MVTKKTGWRAKTTPSYMKGAPVSVMLWLDEEVHKAAKEAALRDRRPLKDFCIVAIEEKIARMQENDIDAKGFVPPGLRK